MAEARTDVVPVPRLDVRVRSVHGVMVLTRGEAAVELSDTARFIWRRTDGRRTIRELAELVAAEYDIELETAIVDVTELVESFAERTFLDLSPGS